MVETIIYCATGFAIGVFLGLIIELAVDNDMLHRMEIENESLLNYNIQLERDNKLLKRMVQNNEVEIARNLRQEGKSLNEIAELMGLKKDYFEPF